MLQTATFFRIILEILHGVCLLTCSGVLRQHQGYWWRNLSKSHTAGAQKMVDQKQMTTTTKQMRLMFDQFRTSDASVCAVSRGLLWYYGSLLEFGRNDDIITRFQAWTFAEIKWQNGDTAVLLSFWVCKQSICVVFVAFCHPFPQDIGFVMDLFGTYWRSIGPSEGVFPRDRRISMSIAGLSCSKR